MEVLVRGITWTWRERRRLSVAVSCLVRSRAENWFPQQQGEERRGTGSDTTPHHNTGLLVVLVLVVGCRSD